MLPRREKSNDASAMRKTKPEFLQLRKFLRKRLPDYDVTQAMILHFIASRSERDMAVICLEKYVEELEAYKKAIENGRVPSRAPKKDRWYRDWRRWDKRARRS